MRSAPRAARIAVLAVLLGLGLPGIASGQSAKPVISAPAAILVEPTTEDVVFARRADSRRPIASATKLMTALLALERLELGDVLVQVPYRGAPAESIAGFAGGERVTVRDELRALLLASANDAANTLAVRISGSPASFVRAMNARARRLRLSDTRYANPVGLDDPGNFSTAADLVKLTLELRTHAFFRQTVDRSRVTIRSGAFPRTFVNRNTLVRSTPSVDGVKTGRTSGAGYVLVGSATAHGITVFSAVLGTQSEAARDSDTLALLRYGLRRYRRSAAVRAGQPFARVPLRYRDATVALVARRRVVRTVRRGERLDVRVSRVPRELDGPLARGAKVGTLVVRQRGKVVAWVALVTTRAVAKAGAGDRVTDAVAAHRTALGAGALGLGSLALAALGWWGMRTASRRRPGRLRSQ